MKIVKHKFKKTSIEVVGGVPTVKNKGEETCYFALLTSSNRLFEQMYGKPLMEVFTEGGESNKSQIAATLFNPEVIEALASSMYLKINGSSIQNDELSQMEFIEKGLPLENDIYLMNKLFESITASMPDVKEDKKKVVNKRNKKKQRHTQK